MSATSTAVIAAVAAQRRKLIRHFVSAGAVSPEQALAADSLPHARFRMLERLKRDGVVLTTAEGKLYLDQERAAQLQARRQARATWIIAAIVVVMAIAAFAAWAVR